MLLKGRGCCIQAVRSDPERYHSELLWACGHELAFDAQCEGSRAWYVYTMIEYYEDRMPFLYALINALDKSRSTGGWKLQYIAEVLMHFVLDGSVEAEDALWRKYEQLYAILCSKKRRPRRYFSERDDFAALCIDMGERKQAMIRIAKDIGKLYRESSIYDGWDFDWLYQQNGKKYLSTLQKLAGKSENIAAYLRVSEAWEEEERKIWENRPNSEKTLSIRLRSEGNPDLVWEYVERYLRETEPEDRARVLRSFGRCPYPGDPDPLLADALSENEELRFAALRALEELRHPKVRQFALDHMQEAPEDYFPLLVRNYEDTDESFVTDLLQSTPTDHACTTSWHALHLDILNMEDSGLVVPEGLLFHIYETTYCSCCRSHALRQLGARRLIPREILEEAAWDSNADVRNYARKLLRGRK